MPINIQNPHLPAPAYPMTPRNLANVTDLIFHHSDGPANQTPAQIDTEHRNQGWAMCGYNYIIDGGGNIWACRPVDVVPSASYGRNAQSINVCLLGDFEPGTNGYTGAPAAAQLQSAKELSVYLHQQYSQIVRTIGHGDVATLFYPSDPGDYSTACPGQDLRNLLGDIRTYTRQSLPHI